MLKTSLRSFGLALLASISFAGSALAGSLQDLQTQLNPQMDALIRAEVLREKVGFEGQWIGNKNACERCGSYSLKLPGHVERDTLMNVTLSFVDQKPVLSGQILTAAERDLLVKAVSEQFGAPTVKLEVFPFSQIAKDYAIANEQAVNLYVKPQAVAGENLATQMRLGTPVKVLAYSADQKFARVRVEDDGYIAWVLRKQLVEGDADWYQDWLAKRSVLVMTDIKTKTPMYYGTRLKLVEHKGNQIIAALPNGSQIALNVSDVYLNEGGILPKMTEIISTAKQFLPKGPHGGGDYLWGGTLGNRLDCSGFTQTVYRMNGVFLPRDADQQKGFTQRVGNTLKDLAEMKAGDLVFFSGNGSYPTHVGLYLGNNQVIHSSAKGPYNGVKISTLKGGDKYDQYLQSIYMGGGRVTRSL